MLDSKKIILGVSGSIAAYKSVYLLRLLKKAGAEVQVVTSSSVDHFVGELSFSSLSGRPVFTGLWDEEWSAHVEIGTWADLMVVAPATANTLAKFASGLCDNALTAVYLAARCPVMLAPAMDVDMYLHPSTRLNLDRLAEYGNTILPTGTGFLASGLEGPGRLLEPEEILSHIQQQFQQGPLHGKKVMITAGPTREALDPVRFITNHSTGKMGYSVAEAARSLGAEVTLISGPTNLETPKGVETFRVNTSEEMYQAVHSKVSQQDIIIMSAAVSDYRPKVVADQKLKKGEGDLVLEMERTRDILKSVGRQKKKGQILVGFALETHDEMKHAQSKLKSKNLDLIVMNSLRDPGAGFAHNTNQVTLIDQKGEVERFPLKDKKIVAQDIMQKIIQLITS